MREMDYINSFIKYYKSSSCQKNRPFECDAEIVEINGQLFGFTIDEFSYEEDLFDDKDLIKLGKNLAISTISDLFAAGCAPIFYMHSIVTPRNNPEFAQDISKGIQDILGKCGCFLIGGDLGSSEKWRYTGVAMGNFINSKPISRIIPANEQNMWVTGTLGDSNLSAFTGSSTPDLDLRINEAEIIRKHANSCIDTSGGFIESLWTLRLLNPSLTFYVNPSKIPYDKHVLEFCNNSSIPKEAFLFGGAGEYELLFTTDTNIEIENVTKIGIVKASGSSQIFWGDKEIKLTPPDAREFVSKELYIQHILEAVEQCI